MSPGDSHISRRKFVALSAGTMLAAQFGKSARAEEKAAHFQASGVKVGEITESSALVWVRHSSASERNNAGVDLSGEFSPKEPKQVSVAPEKLEGACPGAPGRVRCRYGTRPDLEGATETAWVDVSAKTDFSHTFQLTGLSPNTLYHYETQTALPDGNNARGSLRGKFETAPAAAAPGNFSFCVMSCQAYHDRDHHDGHHIYPSMLAQKPKFVVFTGDNVYYDRDEPRAMNEGLARYHWERMFSLPRQFELLRNVGSYWEKDDHDTVKDDSWPGVKLGDLTFEQGQQIFRQQVPIGQSPYRTFRWGRDVQIWFTEGRDFRSPNTAKDGADKSIWGRAQEDWFKQTVAQSDATWKILISPTPLVGPDRAGKNDNHTNRGFQHEGDEIRAWIKEHAAGNFFVVCGDRHWQYHSVHPQSGVVEFSVGAASDAHAGGSPGENPDYHRFHRQKGGFLSIDVRRSDKESAIAFRLHDVLGAVKYEWKTQRVVPA